MKKKYKILFSILTLATISTFSVLTPVSCYSNSNDSNNNKPNPPIEPNLPDQEKPPLNPEPEKPPINPNPIPPKPEQPKPPIKPQPPVNPDPLPPNPPQPPIKPDEPKPEPPLPNDPVNINSITIKNNNLLPSMFISNNELDISKFNINIGNITNYNLELISYNDLIGELKIKLRYVFNNIQKEYLYYFNNLYKFNSSSKLKIKINKKSKINDISALEFSKYKINNINDLKNIINLLSNYIDINFNIDNLFDIDFNYLSISSADIIGFDESWFSSDLGINLIINLSNITGKAYKFENNIRDAIMINFNRVNSDTTIGLEFGNASTYVLNKTIINNNFNFKTLSIPSYYYLDLKYNNGIEVNKIIRNNGIISFIYEITYNNEVYVFNSSVVDILNVDDINGSVEFLLEIKCNTNYGVSTSESKIIKFNKLFGSFGSINNAFNYDYNNIAAGNIFSVNVSNQNMELINNTLQKYKKPINNLINSSNEQNIKITLFNQTLINGLITPKINLYYDHTLIIYDETVQIYTNQIKNNVYIQKYSLINPEVWFDKTNNRFWLRFILSIELSSIIESNKMLDIPITLPNSWTI